MPYLNSTPISSSMSDARSFDSNDSYLIGTSPLSRSRSDNELLSTPSNDGNRSISSQRLIVSMDFAALKKSRGPSKKTIDRRRAKSRMRVKRLQENLQRKQRQVWKLEKRVSKLTAARVATPNKSTLIENQEETPRSSSRRLMEISGVKISRVSRNLYSELVKGRAVLNEVKKTVASQKRYGRRVVARVLSGRYAKKYRCSSFISRHTHNYLAKFLSNQHQLIALLPRRIRGSSLLALIYNKKVQSFYERDEVSRVMPGKNDYVAVDGKKVQKRIMNDYLKNIYERFSAEYPTITISFSLFCSMRPVHILKCNLLSRNTCLCSRHQNMALKFAALKKVGVSVPANPDVAARTLTITEFDQKVNALQIPQDEVKVFYEAWKRVTDETGKKKMKIVTIGVDVEAFKKLMIADYIAFLDHVDRVFAQYEFIRKKKEALKPGEVLVQMDFSENFLCQTNDEIQSAYWNATAVTLHPIVVYYRTTDDGELSHKSYVLVSEELAHNTTAVYTILKKFVPQLMADIPNVAKINYVTDSPTSQYRNRTIFHILHMHKKLFGVPASWFYFEAGHGKGPCDGIGGTAKRSAQDAVKLGKCLIQDANDFYLWASQHQQAITYLEYFGEDYKIAECEIMEMKKIATPIKGTMKLHAIVVDYEEHTFLTRDTACSCETCVAGLPDLNCKWNVSCPMLDSQPAPDHVMDVKVGDWVAALYDEQCYIGKVVQTDGDDDEVEVSFMVKAKEEKYKWPQKEDLIWIGLTGSDRVLCIITLSTPLSWEVRTDKWQNLYFNYSF